MSVATAAETRPEGYPDTPELDKEARAREEPVEGGLAKFVEWAYSQGIRWCSFDEVGERWVETPKAVIMGLITEGPATSEDVGELIDDLADRDLMRCTFLGNNADEVRAEILQEKGQSYLDYTPFAVSGDPRYRPKGWYPSPEQTYPLLARFYGVDLKAADRERDAVLAWVRANNAKGGQG